MLVKLKGYLCKHLWLSWSSWVVVLQTANISIDIGKIKGYSCKHLWLPWSSWVSVFQTVNISIDNGKSGRLFVKIFMATLVKLSCWAFKQLTSVFILVKLKGYSGKHLWLSWSSWVAVLQTANISIDIGKIERLLYKHLWLP